MSWELERFAQFGDRLVATGDEGGTSYADFVDDVRRWRDVVRGWGVAAGDRVGLVADYHIGAVALLQALIATGCIVIPLAHDDRALFDERLRTVCANQLVTVDVSSGVATAQCQDIAGGEAMHPLLAPLVAQGRAGFVIFTSGSTGKGKAVLLDHERLTRKFRHKVREASRTLLFLKLDHIGGLNTLFSVIYNGGTIVTCASRRAGDICAAIARHHVALLPTTPSFLTMLLMSGQHREYDLSSLRTITYGTEVMPDSTLAALGKVFPAVQLKQTYGLSELGILSTRSRDSTSKWMQIGGEGYSIKVEDGTLWIKTDLAMLGYLNAPSPFDADGWYHTGDKVEVDGEWFRILGRESEVINVAGEKVFPIEIESFLLTLPNVRDVLVREKKSPVTGQMIWAEFLRDAPEEPAGFRRRVVAHCQGHLAPFKVPGFITIASGDSFVGSRFKKIRRSAAADASLPTVA